MTFQKFPVITKKPLKPTYQFDLLRNCALTYDA